MRIIQSGGIYEIYGDGIKTREQLPAQNYVVRFQEQKGFYLEEYPSVQITESKIYGKHLSKVAKVLSSFKIYKRNLGVILSGDKGIGKSLCAKILAAETVRMGYPVIFVDTFYPGIASYIEKIDQECMVMFDEFDKTFGGVRSKEGFADPQAGLLTLFDGISPGKKLFVITCNSLRTLNDYLVNRPGRFHYHFRFEYPNAEEIKEYLQDKLDEAYWGEIDKVILFAKKVDLNYDCLRSIAFELNLGLSFSEAIKDLNILNLSEETYTMFLHFTDGSYFSKKIDLDMFSNEEAEYTFYNRNQNGYIHYDITFNPAFGVYDAERKGVVINAKDCSILLNEDYTDKERMEEAKSKVPEYLRFVRVREKQVEHYNIV